VPVQNELNEFSEAKTNQTKRRSSLGSGLLKLIGGKSQTCKDEQKLSSVCKYRIKEKNYLQFKTASAPSSTTTMAP
jgi:hypothetical protein